MIRRRIESLPLSRSPEGFNEPSYPKLNTSIIDEAQKTCPYSRALRSDTSEKLVAD